MFALGCNYSPPPEQTMYAMSTLYTVQYVQCSMYSVQCTVYSVQSVMFIAHSTLLTEYHNNIHKDPG